jgi:hypothetical protein
MAFVIAIQLFQVIGCDIVFECACVVLHVVALGTSSVFSALFALQASVPLQSYFLQQSGTRSNVDVSFACLLLPLCLLH